MPQIPDFSIPAWLPYFIFGGIGLVIILVPLKILWEATKSRRERSHKLEKFIDRLRERFGEVVFHRGLFGPSRVTMKHEGRKLTIWIADLDELIIQLDENIGCPFAAVIKTRGRWRTKWAMIGLRVLPLFQTHDPMIDDAVAIYTDGPFGGYLFELIHSSVTKEGKPSGVAESLIVIRRAPGVKSFRLWMTPGGPMRLRVSMHAEDMLYRPDEMETIVHHLQQLYDKFAGY